MSDNNRKDVWLTRDKDGNLKAWDCCKPIKKELYFSPGGMCWYYQVPSYLFKEVTWENSPVIFPISKNRLEAYDNEVQYAD